MSNFFQQFERSALDATMTTSSGPIIFIDKQMTIHVVQTSHKLKLVVMDSDLHAVA